MPRNKKTEEQILSVNPALEPRPEETAEPEVSPEIAAIKSKRTKKAAIAPPPVEASVPAAPAASTRRKKAVLLPSDAPAVVIETQPEPEAAPPAPKAEVKKPRRPTKKEIEALEPAPLPSQPATPSDNDPKPLTFGFRTRTLREEAEEEASQPPVVLAEKPAPAEPARKESSKKAPKGKKETVAVPLAVAVPSVGLGTTDPMTFAFRARTAGSPRVQEAFEDESQAPAPAPQAEVEPTEPAVVIPEPRILGYDEDRDLTVSVWRPRTPASKRPPMPVLDDQDGDEGMDGDDRGRGRHRRRRRGGRPDEEMSPTPVAAQATETAEPQAAAPAPVKPVEPVRPRIAIPTEAPQVVLRNGVPNLVYKKKVIAPLFFTVGGVEGAEASVVAEQVKMAAENGIHLFGLSVNLEVSPEGVDTVLHLVQQGVRVVRDADPEGMVIIRLGFIATPDHSLRGYKGRSQSPTAPSLSDDEFWGRANALLGETIQGLGKTSIGNAILGVHLDREEWFIPEDAGYEDSPASRAKFGAWLRHRYRNDVVSLRASWFDGKVTFDQVAIPDFKNRHGSDTDFVRLDRRARRWVDFNLFLSDLAVERIVDLAYEAKKSSGGQYLVGVSYGYTFEWSHPGSAHLSLGKLLRCPEVDYIAGPPSYKSREPGGSGAFPWPIDSFALNGKLALSEEDFRTSIGRGESRADNPVMRTPQALESAHWRGAGSVLAHGGGLNWMDRNSLGWLNSRGIWERGQKVSHSLLWRSAIPVGDPDVALFIDERSLAYLADHRAFEELVQDVRESILRSGLSVGFYLLSDLAHRENFPEAKVNVFVNAWDMRPEVRSAIKTRLQRDNKVLLWLYCAGLFEGGRESLERAREVTGIALRPQPFNSRPGTSLINTRDPLCRVLPDDQMAQGGTLEPSYFAIPEDASVLGEYTQTGLPSFVVRKFPSPNTSDEPWTSVFLGEPVVSPGLFRSLGQMAGAHVWCLDDDVLHVRPPFLTIHCSGAVVRTITLPDKWSCYDLIQKVWMPVENSNLRFLGLDGVTYSFLVGHKSEIEAILASGPAPQLTEEEILAHQDNTIQWDAISLDVPIMKLDEWVEENWGEDMADDLLIRPSMVDEIEEEEESEAGAPAAENSRSTTNRRRRGKKQKGGRPDPGHAAQEKAQPINFLFRKRE